MDFATPLRGQQAQREQRAHEGVLWFQRLPHLSDLGL